MLQRYLRRLPLDAATYRRRALFLVGGVVVGCLAVMMAVVADRAQQAFALLVAHWHWAPFLVTPAGFAVSAYLTRRFFPGAQGSGIPQVIAARKLDGLEARSRLVSLRLAAAKIGLLMLGLLCGASSGREGPTVQVGAATMAVLGRLEPHRQPGLLLAGSAAGIAAAFNAPLAGIIFGIEEMSRSFEQRSSVLVLVTVIAAGLTSLTLLGNYTYFGIGHGAMLAGWQWLSVPIVLLVGGLLGGIFSRFVIAIAHGGVPQGLATLVRNYPVVFAAACGLLVAICGLLSDNSTFGTGYAQAQAIQARLTTMVEDFRAKRRDADYLAYRCDEMRKFAPTREDYDAVLGLTRRSGNTLALVSGLEQAQACLDQGAGGEALSAPLWEATRLLTKLEAFTPDFRPLAEEAATLASRVDDLSYGIGKASSRRLKLTVEPSTFRSLILHDSDDATFFPATSISALDTSGVAPSALRTAQAIMVCPAGPGCTASPPPMSA